MAKTIPDIVHDENVEHEKFKREYVYDDDDDEYYALWQRALDKEKTTIERAADLARSLTNAADKDNTADAPKCSLMRYDSVVAWNDKVQDMVAGILLKKTLFQGFWEYQIEAYDKEIGIFDSPTAIRK